MVASVGATLGMLTRCPSRPIRPRPTTSPTTAVITGIPAAMRAPKVKAMMTTAAAMPMVSLRRDLDSASLAPMPPPASTWTPAARAGSAAARMRPATCLSS